MYRNLHVLFLLATFALNACSKKEEAKSVRIEELGVEVHLPDGFTHQKKRETHWISKNDFYSAQLRKKDKMPESLAAAVASWGKGEVSDKGTIEGGGFYAVIQAEFPGEGGETMKLPFVNVIVPAKAGAVYCGGQLQPKDDPKALLEACKAIKTL